MARSAPDSGCRSYNYIDPTFRSDVSSWYSQSDFSDVNVGAMIEKLISNWTVNNNTLCYPNGVVDCAGVSR